MLHQRVTPVNQGAETILAPDKPASVTVFGGWQRKADPLLVGFAFYTLYPTSRAPKAGTPGLASTDAIGRAIGTGSERVGGIRVKVLLSPGAICLSRKRMEGILAKPMGFAQRRAGGFAGHLLRARDETCLLPAWISPHPAQAFQGFREQGPAGRWASFWARRWFAALVASSRLARNLPLIFPLRDHCFNEEAQRSAALHRNTQASG
jgi:hypothetical protein